MSMKTVLKDAAEDLTRLRWALDHDSDYPTADDVSELERIIGNLELVKNEMIEILNTK